MKVCLHWWLLSICYKIDFCLTTHGNFCHFFPTRCQTRIRSRVCVRNILPSRNTFPQTAFSGSRNSCQILRDMLHRNAGELDEEVFTRRQQKRYKYNSLTLFAKRNMQCTLCTQVLVKSKGPKPVPRLTQLSNFRPVPCLWCPSFHSETIFIC